MDLGTIAPPPCTPRLGSAQQPPPLYRTLCRLDSYLTFSFL